MPRATAAHRCEGRQGKPAPLGGLPAGHTQYGPRLWPGGGPVEFPSAAEDESGKIDGR